MALQLLVASMLAAATALQSWELETSLRLIRGVKARTSNARPLDLLDDLYDAPSGLVGEGVWHNAHFGAAQLLAARRLEGEAADELRADAKRLGDSLFALAFDGGFRRRTASGFWRAPEASIADAGERPGFYEPSRDRRCVGNAAAVVFYSLLREDCGDDRLDEIGDAFLELFFEDGRFRRGARGDGGPSYLRAVDQAAAALACRRLARAGNAAAREAASAAADALRADFGYGARPTNHVGDFEGTRRRNSWHDAFAVFALALDDPAAAPALVAATRDDYESEGGLLAHQARDAGPSPRLGDGSSVRFTCTQAVWSAVGRGLGGFEDHAAAWRAFDEASRDAGGLMPVADAYPSYRLWCQTEPAMWLLVERELFEYEA